MRMTGIVTGTEPITCLRWPIGEAETRRSAREAIGWLGSRLVRSISSREHDGPKGRQEDDLPHLADGSAKRVGVVAADSIISMMILKVVKLEKDQERCLKVFEERWVVGRKGGGMMSKESSLSNPRTSLTSLLDPLGGMATPITASLWG